MQVNQKCQTQAFVRSREHFAGKPVLNPAAMADDKPADAAPEHKAFVGGISYKVDERGLKESESERGDIAARPCLPPYNSRDLDKHTKVE